MDSHENPHLSRPMTEWGCGVSSARLAVLAVHGRGQNPAFMQDQAERIQSTGVRYYAPSAASDSWYPNPFMDPLPRNEPALSRSIEALGAHLDAIRDDGFGTERILLWGFSQGACLLSQYVLNRPGPFAGLILLTGGYLGPVAAPGPAGRPLDAVPALLRTIEHDPWVPRHRVEETAAALRTAGADVGLRIAPGRDHVITDEAMTAATALINRLVFDRTPQRKG